MCSLFCCTLIISCLLKDVFKDKRSVHAISLLNTLSTHLVSFPTFTIKRWNPVKTQTVCHTDFPSPWRIRLNSKLQVWKSKPMWGKLWAGENVLTFSAALFKAQAFVVALHTEVNFSSAFEVLVAFGAAVIFAVYWQILCLAALFVTAHDQRIWTIFFWWQFTDHSNNVLNMIAIPSKNPRYPIQDDISFHRVFGANGLTYSSIFELFLISFLS